MDTNTSDSKYTASKTRGHKSQFTGHSMSLRSKFLMGTALILIVVCFISAFIIYYREKNLLEESAYSHTELVMASVEASRAYVRDELRPRMIQEFGYDFFMLEAMSTSYVGRAVMDKLKTSLPEYSYRRVSINARNPASEAREMEKGMIGFFRENQAENNWQGLVDMDGEANYMRFKPVYFEESCMSCHGDPADAPQELLNLYGADRGFGHYPGELAGVIAVGIPVQSALSAIKEKSTSVFLVVFLGVSFFYLILSFFFNWIVVNNLRGVINLFKEDVDEKKLPEIFDSDNSADEMEALSRAAQNMAAHLKQNSEELKKYAHNLEVKVAERTSDLQESKQLLKDKVITRNKELQALNSIAELTTQARGLADIWPEAVRQCLQLIPARGVGIYLLDEHTGTLKIRYEYKAADLPREVGCLKVSVIDISTDSPELRSMEKSMCLALKGSMDSFTSEKIGQCLNVPLHCRGTVFGVMSFVRVDYQEITLEQKELLLSIGRQMGIAIDSLNGLHKLIQSKELLQSVFDGITDLVILLDRNYRIKMVNKAYLNKYQIELEDVLNLHCFEAHSGTRTSCPNCDMQEVIKTGKPRISETKCGTGQVYLVNFYPILNDRGEVESVIRYARDITDQKKVEQKIQQTEKLVSAGKLAAGVAHEINNPLGIILCYTDLLKRQLSDFPQGLKDLNIIEKQTLNCKRIVTDLLHFSRGHKSEKVFSSLNRAIEDVIQIFKHQLKKQKISFDLDLDPDLPQVNFNEDSIKQVFVNLIMNSSQAIHEGGKILISSRYIQKENMARITFWDSGTGLKPENRNRIFDPFFSTKKTGESTGLGLSVSYGIIQDHGGDISVKSSPGEWTEFTVHLPVSGN